MASDSTTSLLSPIVKGGREKYVHNKTKSMSNIEVMDSSLTLDLPVSDNVFDPSFFLAQFAPYPSFEFSLLKESPRPIPDDDASRRALSVLDRTPVTNLHKIGVVYVAPGQTNEVQILQNSQGSILYTQFLLKLGQLFSLANCKTIYTGGLDTSSEEFDGKIGLFFMPDQRLDQLVFHVTTLMPTRKEDPMCTGKKRHIGNDYVTIVWNEGGPYKHDTIPGQFNFIVISIEPVSSSSSYEGTLFRVSLSTQEQLPEPRPTIETKVMMGSSLGDFVRQLSIQVNMYCQIAASKEYVSNTRERLSQIKRLKARIHATESGHALDFTKHLG